MKKTSTLLKMLALGLCGFFTNALNAQSTVEDFETYSLPAQSFYKDTSGADFGNHNISFEYNWNKTYSYWSAGFAYTNITDSTTSGYTNIYASKAFKGYNNSANYATGQGGAKINLTGSLTGKVVAGLYICNSTYAANSMRDGDNFAKKFGGASGNDPDWFKLTIRKYYGGVMTNDSVDFYLADYRFANNSQDYIVKNWTWLDLSTLGNVDSLKFLLSSSDVGTWGMNTPAFFCLDDFTVNTTTGLSENNKPSASYHFFPNPASDKLSIAFNVKQQEPVKISLFDFTGREVYAENTSISKDNNTVNLNIETLNPGVYFLNIKAGNTEKTSKFIKQ